MQETTITPVDISEFTFGQGKTGYNIQTQEGQKYACFSSTEMAKVIIGHPAKIRFEEKTTGNYTNRNIKQVADDQGNFEDKPQSSSGGRVAKADPDKLKQEKDLEIARNKSIQRQVAAKEATVIALASETPPSANFWNVWDGCYNHILDKLLEVK